MRVVVLAASGNVGTTVIAEHLLAPRVKAAVLIRLGGLREPTGPWRHRDEVCELFADLLENDRVVIDVAGRATPALLAGMRRFASITDCIDYCVVPVTPSPKVQLETLTLLTRLAHLGLKADQIRIVFNRVEDTVDDEFAPLLTHLHEHGGAIANQKAFLIENELFDILLEENLTIEQVLSDATDYKTLLRQNRQPTTEQWQDWVNRYGIQCLTRHIHRNLETSYAELFG